MKKISILIITLFITFYFNTADAQSRPDAVSFHSRVAKSTGLLNLLPSNQASAKTTFTTKKINATSSYAYGDFQDSFLVTVPTTGGTSKLWYLDLYVTNNLPVINQYTNLVNPYDLSFVDFKEAIQYRNNLDFPDSIYRTMNAQNEIENSVIKYYSTDYGLYANWEVNYQYDNKGRITHYEDIYDDSTEPVSTIKIDFSYSPDDDYIIAIFEEEYDTSIYYYYDSMALNSNGNIEYYYSIGSEDSVASDLFYTYNSNNQFISAIGYFDGDLSARFEVVPTTFNSDFPDYVEFWQYFNGDSGAYVLDYHYDNTTNRLESVDEWQISNDDSTAFTADVITDGDGDITQCIWEKLATGDTAWVTNFYYEATPNSIQEDHLFDADVKVYPVPSSGIVNLNSTEMFDGYSIYDQNGRIILRKIFNKTNNAQVDLGSFAKGVYFLKVRSNGREKSIQIERE